MFNPIQGIEKSAWSALKGKSQISLGAHNSLLQMGQMSYGSATAWGAGVGATYGGIEGAMSYDGSFFGGAVHGAMVGAAGGAGGRFASGLYTTGSKGVVGDAKGRFAWKHFGDGWTDPTTP